MGMFDNYPQPANYVPNNRPRIRDDFHLDIMTGETASHSFDVPFDVETTCQEVEVLYKLGLKVIISKNSTKLDIIPMSKEGPRGTFNYTKITCHLNENETSLFCDTYLNAKVQLKFTMNDKSVQYSEIYPIAVVNSVDTDKVAPGIVAGIGYGWTED